MPRCSNSGELGYGKFGYKAFGCVVTDVVLAPAKLTLSLRVTGVRADGYHLVDAEMVSLSLADELTIGSGDGLEVVEAGSGLPVSVGPDNLVSRALAVAGCTAHVRLVKRIPAGAGLGGAQFEARRGKRVCRISIRLGERNLGTL